ncbi:DUF523 domain-containing protein [Persephonella atlantica]|uniref:DUF523 domain-containing protein n=1 Tax=Persephonella atlantica TaxID=2699429 RepID=A0ABS1GF12_9AQUI|nr:DUF523 domain-containing protein [Persephonella atlantica]MBK3331475.1 DUF523 domain-containing protein [Persephonella atlantica]
MDKKPVLVVSGCLVGEKVRYNGKDATDHFAVKLSEYINVVKVCPEVGAGLGIPRKKVFLVKKNGYALFQEETGKELTQEINRFSDSFLSSLKGVDGFLLKSKSPSCGVYYGAKTYRNANRTGYVGRRKGLFAQAVKKRFPFHPIEDEERLKDFYIRFVFLTKVYLFFYYREYGADYLLEKYPHMLKLFSNKGFDRFIKNRNDSTFYSIFKKNIRKKIFLFLERGIKEDFLIFPKELLNI